MKLSPFTINLPQPFLVNNHILFRENTPIGILNPGIIIGKDQAKNAIQITGPKGVSWAKLNNPEEILTALIATNSILLGEIFSILKVQEYLTNDAYSRTASYLCSIVERCEEIDQFFKRISNASVALIGCGGIGSLSALLLAGAGVRKLILVDPDTIETSNFNRQFFWTIYDIGLYKVNVLKQRLEERYQDINISTCIQKIEGKDVPVILSNADSILFTADEPVGLIRDVRRQANESKKIFVSGGYILDEAVVSGSSIERKEDSRILQKLSNGIAPSFGPTNVEVAGAATSLLLFRLAGFLKDEVIDVSWKVNAWPWSLNSV